MRLHNIILPILFVPLVWASDFPPVSACEAIMLRMSQGWWLRVNADGGGAYGFGVLMDRIAVREGSFDFQQMYDHAKDASVEQRGNAEAPYTTVSCFATGRGSGPGFYLTDEAWIASLFRTARKNRIWSRNEGEERQYRKIEAFWEKTLLKVTPSSEEPMAPFVGPKKKEVLKKIAAHRQGQLEITLGRNEPQFLIRFRDGGYELCPLILDRARAEQSAREKQSQGYYMPEMDWHYSAPGIPIIRETDRESFVLRLESWFDSTF